MAANALRFGGGGRISSQAAAPLTRVQGGHKPLGHALLRALDVLGIGQGSGGVGRHRPPAKDAHNEVAKSRCQRILVCRAEIKLRELRAGSRGIVE